MRRFARAAIFVGATSGALLTGALMDHSVDSVLGAPDTGGGCSSSCAVGGADLGADPAQPQAQGGYRTGPFPPSPPTLGDITAAGTIAIDGGAQQGHTVVTGPGLVNGTLSGNFTDPENPRGHCTEGLASLCGG